MFAGKAEQLGCRERELEGLQQELGRANTDLQEKDRIIQVLVCSAQCAVSSELCAV